MDNNFEILGFKGFIWISDNKCSDMVPLKASAQIYIVKAEIW